MDDDTVPAAGARILVVDDEPTSRMAITEALNLMGYRADEAASGPEALELLAYRPYDLMLLDLRMPGMDGVEVMKRARQAHSDLLVIVLTAYGTLESALEAIRAGAADYLLKPSSLRDTEAAIHNALRRREARTRQASTPVTPGELDLLFPGGAVDTSATPEPRERFLRQGLVTLDRERSMLIVAGIGDKTSYADLTASEAALLDWLMRHPNQVFGCRELARDALHYELLDQEAEAIVRPHISRLRHKVEPDAARPQLIRTVHGKGYLFSTP